MFTTYTGNYQVVIACLLLHQSGMSVDEIQTDVQRAGAEFAGMLAHLTVDVR